MSRSGLASLALAAALAATWAPLARGQGLGDAAARERQKREAQKETKPARAFGNDDLPKAEADEPGRKKAAPEPVAAPTIPNPSDAGASGTGDDAGSVLAARKSRIADAQAAKDAAQAAVDRIQARIRQLQDMLNPMSGSYIYGSATTGDMAGAEARVREELRQSEAQLAEAQKALEAAGRGLEDAELGRAPSP